MRTLLAFCTGAFCIGIGGLFPLSLVVANPPAPAKVVRYAEVMIKRYDTNGDGILQKEEWEKMPGTPLAIDLDGNGEITKDELTWYFTQYGQTRTIHRTVVRDLSEPYRFDPGNLRFLRPVTQWAAPPTPDPDTTQERPEGDPEEIVKANEEPVDDDIYQKMLEERQVPSARPYHVLPEHLRGVPRWFIMWDRNGDGQISLQEFAPTLAPRLVELFKRFDKNNNGVIEPDEVRSP